MATDRHRLYLRLTDIAEQRVADAYAHAIAAQVERQSDTALWDEFEREYQNAHLVIAMLATHEAYAQAVKAGLALEPQVFGREDDDDIELVFGRGQHDEALSLLIAKQPRTREHVDRLREQASVMASRIRTVEQAEAVGRLRRVSVAFREALSRSFWVSDVEENVVLNLRGLLADAIRTGVAPQAVTLPTFIESANLVGASHLTRARLEVIYRTNLSAAHNEGTSAALQAREVQAWMPLVQLDEIRDSRTRSLHAMMDGYTNTLAEFKRWNIVPPNGFNCRATLRGVTRAEARRMGLVDDRDQLDPRAVREFNGDKQRLLETGAYPDDGFRSAA